MRVSDLRSCISEGIANCSATRIGTGVGTGSAANAIRFSMYWAPSISLCRLESASAGKSDVATKTGYGADLFVSGPLRYNRTVRLETQRRLPDHPLMALNMARKKAA